MPGFSGGPPCHPVLLRGTAAISFVKGVAQGTTIQSALATAASGGGIANGTYFVKVTALTAAGESLPSNEQSVTTTGTGISTITVTWAAVAGATGYKVYFGNAGSGSENIVSTLGVVTSNVFTALPATSGTPPTAGSGAAGDTLIYGFHILSNGTAVTVTLTGFIDSEGNATSITWTGSTSADTLIIFPAPILNEFAALAATCSVDAKAWLFTGAYNAAGSG